MSHGRHRMTRRKSRKVFSRTAGHRHVHPKNMMSTVPMRGGIRL